MNRHPSGGDRCVIGGVAGGVAGGLAVLVLGVAQAAINGLDAWPALKAASLPLFGARALAPGFEGAPVLVGLTGHFAIATIWAGAFAALAYGLPRAATIVAAFAWGLVVWFGMHVVVLRLIGCYEVVSVTPIGLALFQHLLFGLAMGIGFLPFQRPYAMPAAATT